MGARRHTILLAALVALASLAAGIGAGRTYNVRAAGLDRTPPAHDAEGRDEGAEARGTQAHEAEAPVVIAAHAEAAREPRYHPRAPQEWQGRLVDVSVAEPCDDHGSCGRARACLPARTCGPCERDTDCLKGEACVLNNCVLADRVRCRLRADCPEASLCMLVDNQEYGRRGNEGLFALCSGSFEERRIALAHQDQEGERPDGGVAPAVVPDPLDRRALLEAVQRRSSR